VAGERTLAGHHPDTDQLRSDSSGFAEFVGQLAQDLALDHGLQSRHQKAELGTDVHVLILHTDLSGDAGAGEAERVAVPAVADAVFPADGRGDALDSGLGVLDAAAVPASDVDDGHRVAPERLQTPIMPERQVSENTGPGTIPAQATSARPVYWRTARGRPIPMRLSFLNGEHADFVVEDGVISLGQAEGNTLVLSGRDIAPWHARIAVDQRGIVLEVLDFTARTHVNARPVREKALLRLGDVLCLGVVAMMLKPDRDDAIETTLPADPETTDENPDGAPSRVALRGVAGSHFGRAIALRQRLVVGRAPDCDIVIDDAQIAPHHATIEIIDDAICLRDMGSGAGVLVNGLRLATAVLHTGDQLAFGRDHFLIEAPGLPLRGEVTPVPVETGQQDNPSDAALPAGGDARGSIWWLIGAAALIALGLMWMLLRGA